MKINIWIDNFSRGGLEKSLECFIEENIPLYPDTQFFIHTLATSCPHIRYLNKFECVSIRFYPSRLAAYLQLSKEANLRHKILSFKNHIPFILIACIFGFRKSVWVRHSNTLLAPLRRHLPTEQSLFKSLIAHCDFFLRSVIYSFCPNHFTNSFENSLLLETFSRVKCYTYFTLKPFNDFAPNRSVSCQQREIRIIWKGRLCNSKGIPILIKFLTKSLPVFIQSISHQSSPTIIFDIYTNNAVAMRTLLPSIDSYNLKLQVLPWSSSCSLSDYDIAFLTSFYEGMSNTFLEYIASGITIIAPRTSSGFVEFSFAAPQINFFNPTDGDSLIQSLRDSYDFLLSPLPKHSYNVNILIRQKMINSNNLFRRSFFS